MYISIPDLMLVTFVLVDNWYQHKGARWLGRTVGSKPEFSDSEMLTLMLAIDFFEFTSERRFVEFIRANYLALFPSCLTRANAIGEHAVCVTCSTRCANTGPPNWVCKVSNIFCWIRLPLSPWAIGGTRTTATFGVQPITATVRHAV